MIEHFNHDPIAKLIWIARTWFNTALFYTSIYTYGVYFFKPFIPSLKVMRQCSSGVHKILSTRNLKISLPHSRPLLHDFAHCNVRVISLCTYLLCMCSQYRIINISPLYVHAWRYWCMCTSTCACACWYECFFSAGPLWKWLFVFHCLSFTVTSKKYPNKRYILF